MPRSPHFFLSTVPMIALLSLLAACGGGDRAPAEPPSTPNPAPPTTEPGAPTATGDTATDTFNWFNYRRQQAGLPALARNAQLDAAAQGHSNYQKLNQTITHQQTSGNPGFTGATIGDRLTAAGYAFTQTPSAYGEVLVATGNPLGSAVAEALLVAIYHRFIVLEPRFREIGVGAAAVTDGYTYVSADLTANGYGPALGAGNVSVYPVAGQQNVPVVFYSDNETPDPVPDRNAVGYPVSVQAGLGSALTVDSFTIRPRGGTALPVRLLSAALDPETPATSAAIVPLDVLAAGTTYEVQFAGSAGGQAVSRSWSFTTQ